MQENIKAIDDIQDIAMDDSRIDPSHDAILVIHAAKDEGGTHHGSLMKGRRGAIIVALSRALKSHPALADIVQQALSIYRADAIEEMFGRWDEEISTDDLLNDILNRNDNDD